MKILVLTILVCVALAAAHSPGSGYYRGAESRGRDSERRASSSGGIGYERQGSGGQYAKGGSYSREKSVKERERGSNFDAGSGFQGSERGRAGGRTDSYGRDTAGSHRYNEGYAPRVPY